MRFPLNLAREPFRRDRSMLIAGGVACALLTITLGALIWLATMDRKQVAESRDALNRINAQITRIGAEQIRLDNEMRRPANADVLDRSVLFNMLIQRKAISWTRIFADLERVLPPTVRVTAVRPHLDARNQLRLDMTVASANQEPALEFMKNLESSEMFGETAASAITSPTQSDPAYHYRVSVNYDQRLPQ